MRKLVTVQKVEKLIPIEGADVIELARIKGWECVVKKGTFKVGDIGIYYEIDSHLPIREPYTAFMATRGVRKSELEDGTLVEGYRVKSIRLKKVLSQGLLLPINDSIPELGSLEQSELDDMLINDVDLSGLLAVVKYEQPIAASNRGRIAGGFPSQWRKSECERVQNEKHRVYESYLNDSLYNVTCKNNGSSISIGKIDGERIICSRNFKLDLTDDSNLFVIMGKRVLDKIDEVNHDSLEGDFMLQGELLGKSIQGGFEGVTEPLITFFNYFDPVKYQYTPATHSEQLVDEIGLTYVQVLHQSTTLKDIFGEVTDADELLNKILDYAEGPSSLNGKYREGLVFKALNYDFQFKAIANSFLLKCE